jgi:hypothetical protein
MPLASQHQGDARRVIVYMVTIARLAQPRLRRPRAGVHVLPAAHYAASRELSQAWTSDRRHATARLPIFTGFGNLPALTSAYSQVWPMPVSIKMAGFLYNISPPALPVEIAAVAFATFAAARFV